MTLDRQGRILIPNYLKKYAGIKQDVVVVGVSNRIEIWSKENWKKFYESSVNDYEAVAEKLFNQDSPKKTEGGDS